jgi:hypothetical protein
MRRSIALAALVLSAALAPATSAKPSLPCDYWVHGCNVADYVCATGVCSDVALPGAPAVKP